MFDSNKLVGELGGGDQPPPLSLLRLLEDENQFAHLLDQIPIDVLNQQLDSFQGSTLLMLAVSDGKESVCKLLISHGVDVNTQNFCGETALYLAASRGYDSTCRLLIDHGANVFICTLEGATAAHIAAACNHLAVLRTLIANGGPMVLIQQDEELETPLHYAVREGASAIVEFIVQLHGNHCCRSTEESGGMFNSFANGYSGSYCDLMTVVNEDGETPLDLAKCLEETEMVQMLLAPPTTATVAIAPGRARPMESVRGAAFDLKPALFCGPCKLNPLVSANTLVEWQC